MKDKRNRHGAVGKSSFEQHFSKSATIALLCEISGVLHLAQMGLMAGKLADEIQLNFEIFKGGCRLKYLTSCSKWLHTFTCIHDCYAHATGM